MRTKGYTRARRLRVSPIPQPINATPAMIRALVRAPVRARDRGVPVVGGVLVAGGVVVVVPPAVELGVIPAVVTVTWVVVGVEVLDVELLEDDDVLDDEVLDVELLEDDDVLAVGGDGIVH
ncbi:MAG: hypothetical protein QOC79_2349 [Actinomycetota bacterium]|nr:hypothetical protein [Actinomycetota bacterium]